MLSALTNPSFPRTALGIEKDRITALALQKEGRGMFGIKQAATVELPNGLVEPSFTKRNIANTSEFRVLLEEAVETAGLADKNRWSVALSSDTARSAILTLDAGQPSGKELEDVLDWKAEQTFGAPASHLRISRYRIGDDADGRARYFASAVSLAVLDEYETIFESYGWKAGLMLPRSVGEANWLIENARGGDSLLISSQHDGFVALLLRGGVPAVVRSVTCTESEREDEIFRLLMFYNDRYSADGASLLDDILLVGGEIPSARIREISNESLGKELRVLKPEDVGLNMPVGSLQFSDLAGPAGLAALAW